MNNKISVEKFIGKNFFLIENRKVELPWEIDEIIVHQNKILILFDSNLPNWVRLEVNQLSTEGRKLSNEASSWLSKYQEVVNKGIWCFDLEGNLIWKMPQAYPEEVHLEELKETGHRAWAAYLGMRINALNDDEVVGWTSYGDHVVARISDGTLVEHYKEGGIPHIRKGTYL